MNPGIHANPSVILQALLVAGVLLAAAVVTLLNANHRRGVPGFLFSMGINALWILLLGGAVWHLVGRVLERPGSSPAAVTSEGTETQLPHPDGKTSLPPVRLDNSGALPSRVEPADGRLPTNDTATAKTHRTGGAAGAAAEEPAPRSGKRGETKTTPPAWLSRQEVWTWHNSAGRREIRTTVHTEFFAPEDELAAREQLDHRICLRAAQLALEQFDLTEAEAALVARKLQNWPQFYQPLVRETYRQEHHSPTAGRMYRLHALVGFDQQAINRLESVVQEVRAMRAARRWVAGFGWVWATLGVLLAAVKMDLGTGGRFRRILQWGAGGIILALGGVALHLAGLWPG